MYSGFLQFFAVLPADISLQFYCLFSEQTAPDRAVAVHGKVYGQQNNSRPKEDGCCFVGQETTGILTAPRHYR